MFSPLTRMEAVDAPNRPPMLYFPPTPPLEHHHTYTPIVSIVYLLTAFPVRTDLQVWIAYR